MHSEEDKWLNASMLSIIAKWFHKGEAFDAESHILLEKIIELEHEFCRKWMGIIGSRKSISKKLDTRNKK